MLNTANERDSSVIPHGQQLSPLCLSRERQTLRNPLTLLSPPRPQSFLSLFPVCMTALLTAKTCAVKSESGILWMKVWGKSKQTPSQAWLGGHIGEK